MPNLEVAGSRQSSGLSVLLATTVFGSVWAVSVVFASMLAPSTVLALALAPGSVFASVLTTGMAVLLVVPNIGLDGQNAGSVMQTFCVRPKLLVAELGGIPRI